MQLHYTPKSHYARKNRILIEALGLAVELIDVGNVANQDPEIFAGNPLLKVPTFITDSGQTIYESDHIAMYLVRTFDPTDHFDVLTTNLDQLNARAVMNGVMAAEVEIILGERTGIKTQGLVRFDKFKATVSNGLNWLEAHADLFTGAPTYAGFHLVCLWDHLVLYEMFELNYPKLADQVMRLSALDCVQSSQPS